MATKNFLILTVLFIQIGFGPQKALAQNEGRYKPEMEYLKKREKDNKPLLKERDEFTKKSNASGETAQSSFAKACLAPVYKGKIGIDKDGSEVCTLPGGGNTYSMNAFKSLEGSCKKMNRGVYPLSIALSPTEKCGTSDFVISCPSRPDAKSDDMPAATNRNLKVQI